MKRLLRNYFSRYEKCLNLHPNNQKSLHTEERLHFICSYTLLITKDYNVKENFLQWDQKYYDKVRASHAIAKIYSFHNHSQQKQLKHKGEQR